MPLFSVKTVLELEAKAGTVFVLSFLPAQRALIGYDALVNQLHYTRFEQPTLFVREGDTTTICAG